MPSPPRKSLPTMMRPSGVNTGAWPNVYGCVATEKGADEYGLGGSAAADAAQMRLSASQVAASNRRPVIPARWCHIQTARETVELRRRHGLSRQDHRAQAPLAARPARRQARPARVGTLTRR